MDMVGAVTQEGTKVLGVGLGQESIQTGKLGE